MTEPQIDGASYECRYCKRKFTSGPFYDICAECLKEGLMFMLDIKHSRNFEIIKELVKMEKNK